MKKGMAKKRGYAMPAKVGNVKKNIQHHMPKGSTTSRRRGKKK